MVPLRGVSARQWVLLAANCVWPPCCTLLNSRSPFCGLGKFPRVVLWNHSAQADLELELRELPSIVVTHVIDVIFLSLLSPYPPCVFSSSRGPFPYCSGQSVAQQSLHTASKYFPTLSPWVMFCWAKNRPDSASATIKGAQGLAFSCAASRVQIMQGKQLLSGRAGQSPAQKGPWDGMGLSGLPPALPEERLRLIGPREVVGGVQGQDGCAQTGWHGAHSWMAQSKGLRLLSCHSD